MGVDSLEFTQNPFIHWNLKEWPPMENKAGKHFEDIKAEKGHRPDHTELRG